MLDQAAAIGTVAGIGHVVLGVRDLAAARDFYGTLGLAAPIAVAWPDCGRNLVYRLASGQHLVLAQGAGPSEPEASAAHVALALSAAARRRLVAALAEAKRPVFDYREDDPAEAGDNCYLVDPSGNRIQLVARGAADGIGAIDHVAIEVSDILWAQAFYGDGLGWTIRYRVGWNTQDYLAAKAKGEAGLKQVMPGSRYWNERYSQFEKERRAIRPNPQIYLDAGNGCGVAVYLASRHYKAPPDTATVGVPRLGFKAKGGFDRLAALLKAMHLPASGPVVRAEGWAKGQSLYVRDPGGNFIAFVTTV